MTTIRVGKYDMRGRLLAETQVQTLAAAHAFLDALDSNGNTTAAPTPVSIPVTSDEPVSDDSPVPG